MAPPWLADNGGVFLAARRCGGFTSEGFDLIGLHMVGGMVSQGQYLVNPVAAMPSLHTAFATLAAGFFWFGKTLVAEGAARLLPARDGLLPALRRGALRASTSSPARRTPCVVIAGWRLLPAATPDPSADLGLCRPTPSW